MSSCENNFDDNQDTKTPNSLTTKLELIGETIKIDNKTELKNIIKSYQKNVEGQNNFNNEIRDLQNKGFKPLTPIFGKDEAEKIEKFILEKKERIRNSYKNIGVSSKSTSSIEINFEDEIIKDPAFAALLNENREIYVSDSLYKYTDKGLYFCLIKDRDKLYSYLSKVSLVKKAMQVKNMVSPCEQEQMQRNLVAFNEITEVTDGIMLFIPLPECDPYGDVPEPTPTPIPLSPKLIKQNLGICTIEKQGFFEKIFGASESCEDYYSDNRRIQVSFWNQNYFLFSSVGCSARFQKHIEHWWASWWEKSYAQNIELGINDIQYDYKFNVPQFNIAEYQYNTVFFEYNGVRFNQEGKTIFKLPTENPGFIFDTDSPQDALSVYIFNDSFELLNAKELNNAIDIAAKSFVSNLPGTYDKYILEDKIKNDKIKYNVVKAVPFSNKVTFKTIGVKWTHNDDNAITQYFDLNFLLTWKSNYSDAGDYLKGLIGGTAYTNVSADIYGAALHNGEWKGKRLLLGNN